MFVNNARVCTSMFARFANVSWSRFSGFIPHSYWKKIIAFPIFVNQNMHAASSAKYMGFRNRLGLEKSPYLLQHANNPVDWYPWGSEAFTKARDENKIVFLSVGYSTCHWCHVMERESFESEEVGRLLNENFVSIKVDREERPDIDHIYMTFVQATSGGGGWPMSVWLTPELVPIVGGTYFPPDDRYFNRPGFKTILNRIATAWRESEADVKAQGQAILNALRRAASQQETSRTSTVPDFNSAVSKCLGTLVSSYDSKLGGFGHAPKFPQPVKLNFLLHVYDFCRRGMLLDKERGQRALDMTLHTLRMMARGGMHDHVGKGFHRYSTDEDWHVPHFEKMLYDQAQLAVIYADAYQITKEELFADVAKDILSYVADNLSDKTGGFYSAEDADSLPTADAAEKREGAFCVWTHSEVQDLLDTDVDGSNVKLADVVCYHFDVQTSGNVDVYKDPHGELTHKNVFIERGDIMQTASHFHLTVEQIRQALNSGKEQLLAHRKLRPPPHLDNKMITAWNGMMISAFAKAGQVFNSDSFVKRAVDAIQFVKSYLYVGAGGTDSSNTNGRLLRSCYIDCDTKAVTQSSTVINGFADDYAFMVRAALDVYETCHDDAWLEWAVELQKIQDELFWDVENAGYFITTSDDTSVILRMKEEQDGAEPSYNSVSARNLLRLSAMLDEPEYRKRAEALLSSFSLQLEKLPVATPELLSALMIHGAPSQQVCVCGTPSSEDTALMLQCIHSHYLPRKTLLVINRNSQATASSFLVSKRKSLSAFDKVDGRATVYVCDNFTCSLPVSDVDELNRLLSNFP